MFAAGTFHPLEDRHHFGRDHRVTRLIDPTLERHGESLRKYCFRSATMLPFVCGCKGSASPIRAQRWRPPLRPFGRLVGVQIKLAKNAAKRKATVALDVSAGMALRAAGLCRGD